MADKTPRERCYHAIRNAMGQGIATYYLSHRTWILDERSKAAVEASRNGLEAILAILDQFDITEKTPDPPKPTQ